MKKFRIIVILTVLVFLAACSNITLDTQEKEIKDAYNNLEVSFIDVGQGDAILIKTPKDKYVLIDSGSQNNEKEFIEYLNKNKIDTFSAVIATHPHEDHIGNLDYVIRQYDILNIYMPKVTANTASFKNLMEEIKNKELKIKKAEAGVSFTIDGVEFLFLAPNKEKYKDLNNYSAVVKVTYKDKSFLMMGDAEKLSEYEIIDRSFDVKADVIKIGHHGSTSSTSKKFLKLVNPEYAVIMCGKGNDYGHPHRETIELLKKSNINIYRTDIYGTIKFIVDGKTLKINTNN
ncbi:beta-lactamase [Fervidicella metallireducens AeB]|uniref:Beta-lactamase n=1 Tax=Fervidicella metallireducens AeB TaxID=1403537 RepID=A0A017RX95_9CLOT|nr:ComEC/Rec2 family competence protein [Fervidicella metallireducens]EYE89009.1 beta-lactamase [Fervidicella metallireducens AeB]